MAEFLVRVADKVNPDSPYLDAKCLKRGDVVVVCPDGWPWSQLERTLPFWRIVRVPGMSLSEAEAFLAPEPGDPLVNKMLQRRQFKLDVDGPGFNAQERAFFSDDARAAHAITISVASFLTVDADTVRALKVMKPPLADPKVIG